MAPSWAERGGRYPKLSHQTRPPYPYSMNGLRVMQVSRSGPHVQGQASGTSDAPSGLNHHFRKKMHSSTRLLLLTKSSVTKEDRLLHDLRHAHIQALLYDPPGDKLTQQHHDHHDNLSTMRCTNVDTQIGTHQWRFHCCLICVHYGSLPAREDEQIHHEFEELIHWGLDRLRQRLGHRRSAEPC